jgi:glycolate oxidase FAD binding subunit
MVDQPPRAEFQPTRTEELVQILHDAPGPFRLVGSNASAAYRLPAPDAADLSLGLLNGIVELFPEDQVVVVRAGTRLSDLQKELAAVGQCLPLPTTDLPIPGTVGGAVALALPHALEAETGAWRDWVLGMRIVAPDGTVAKAGSQAVKNVAGYDVQKLMVGTRGTLGILTEITLRTFPLKALPEPQIAKGPAPRATWTQRTLPQDFARAVAAVGDRLVAANSPSSTLWAECGVDEDLPRYPHDWVMRSDSGAKNLQFTDPTQIRLMKHAKNLFDPEGRLNPGEMGIF